MTTPPTLTLPPGYVLETKPDGSQEVVKVGTLNRTIAWRVPAADYAALLPFVESFRTGQWAEAMRWLFDQPTVRDVIRDRIKSQTTPVQP